MVENNKAPDNDTLKESRPLEDASFTASPPQALIGLFQVKERDLTFSGSALNALSKARTIGKIDSVTKDSITIGDVIIYSNKASKLGIGEAKLLRYGVTAFTNDNAQNEKTPNLRIYADTKDFARANGVKIDPQAMETPEEQEKENQRAAKALDNFVTKLAKNAETLKSNASFSWRETVKGKAKSYSGLSLIGAYTVNSDSIMLEFTQSAAAYIVQLPLSDTPRALYAVDDRKPNAYAIAQALISHYSMDNNVIKNTERILKIETLLKYTSFPTQAKLKEKRWSWENLVKEPFEAALDELTRINFFTPEVKGKDGKRISGAWTYCLSGMKELSDEEAASILSYEQFVSTYIYYELSGYDSHEERVKQITEKREANKEKAAKKRTKTKEKTPPDKHA